MQECCYDGCPKDVEFEVVDVTEGCGCDPYTRYTYTCQDHVGVMLGHTNLEHKEGIPSRWEVLPFVPEDPATTEQLGKLKVCPVEKMKI